MSEISEKFRKVALFGIGALALSQEKIVEFSQEMVKKGEMNREEGKKFLLDVLSEKERQLKEVDEKINKKLKEFMECSGFAMKRDIDDLSERMEKIESAFERLKQI